MGNITCRIRNHAQPKPCTRKHCRATKGQPALHALDAKTRTEANLQSRGRLLPLRPHQNSKPPTPNSKSTLVSIMYTRILVCAMLIAAASFPKLPGFRKLTSGQDSGAVLNLLAIKRRVKVRATSSPGLTAKTAPA